VKREEIVYAVIGIGTAVLGKGVKDLPKNIQEVIKIEKLKVDHF
jgi:hypothetical protein